MVDNGGPKADIYRVGWSLRSGGWPLSFWQYNKPKAFYFSPPVAPEFALDNPPVFLIRFAQNVAANGRYDEIGQLQSRDIVFLGPEVQCEYPVFKVAGLKKTGTLDFQVQPCKLQLPVQRRIALLGDDKPTTADLADIKAETLHQNIQ